MRKSQTDESRLGALIFVRVRRKRLSRSLDVLELIAGVSLLPTAEVLPGGSDSLEFIAAEPPLQHQHGGRRMVWSGGEKFQFNHLSVT